jgi:hypothetical protein
MPQLMDKNQQAQDRDKNQNIMQHDSPLVVKFNYPDFAF